MTIPRISEEAMVSSEKVALAQVEELLNHLEKCEYATLYHTLFAVMWHTGCRISAAIAFDVNDFVQDPVPTENDPDPAPYLKFRNRPEQGTGLKNRAKSERNVSISDDIAELLNDYLVGHRHPIENKHDREPLFCTEHRRLARQRAYKAITRYT